jgi:hypothetical protein
MQLTILETFDFLNFAGSSVCYVPGDQLFTSIFVSVVLHW